MAKFYLFFALFFAASVGFDLGRVAEGHAPGFLSVLVTAVSAALIVYDVIKHLRGVVTSSEVEEAFRRWTIDERAGACGDANEHNALPIDEAAERTTEAFLQYVKEARAAR